MKHTSKRVAILAAAGMGFLSCAKDADTQAAQSAGLPANSWESVKHYAVERSAEFSSFLNQRLVDLDRQLAALSARTGLEAEAENAQFAQKRMDLANRMEALGSATTSTWDAARDEVIALYDELRDAVQRALTNQ